MDQITSFFYGHIPDFLWGLAAFVIFVVILLKVGVKQVLAAVDAREAKIRGDLSEAEQAKASAKLVKTELEAKIKAHEAKIAEMMAEARRDGEALKATMVEDARKEQDAVRVRALREIEAARHAAVLAVRGEVAEIALLIAQKAMHERFDPRKHEELVTLAVEAFEARNQSGAR